MELTRAIYHGLSSFLEPLACLFLPPELEANLQFWQGHLDCSEAVPSPLQRPRVWLHAASVGEVTGAIPIVHSLREQLPKAEITLTVTTPQGLAFARSNLLPWAHVLPFPLDLPSVLQRAIRNLQPDLYVTLESEFWPNLFGLLERHQIPAMLLNGQLSRRSTLCYALLQSLFRPVFTRFVQLAMHTEEDRRNALHLGVPPERICVLGSSKYDALLLRRKPSRVDHWRRILDIPEGLPTIVGGSLRGQESIKLLEVFRALKSQDARLVGILAPRHLSQISKMTTWLEDQGMTFQLFSQLDTNGVRRSSSVILVDRIGLLFELYGLGDLIFCGGTLEPVGGHNIVEPAAWAKAVFYGPHLQKVVDEHNILQGFGGSFVVQNAQDLRHQWQYWLGHLTGLKEHGEKARIALSKLEGVSAKQVALIMSVLSEREHSGK